jgi:ADP-heptose:LPS heptosyltransferase
LIEYLRHDKNKIIVIGSQKDMKSLLWLHDIYPKVEINLSPPFHELVSIISTCSMFIGVDSYPLHIADAYNTNFVGIFGPTNPHSVLVNDKKNIRFEVKSLQSIDSEILVNRIDAFIKETISF